MAASLVNSGTFVFADGNAGHSCALGSSPSVGQWDILCANSDTLVATPSGFTLLQSRVSNQGAYIFGRKAVGGEGSSVTVTTSGNFNCQVSWSRWDNVDLFDVGANAGVDAADGTSTPNATTAGLAATNELVILFAALHGTFTGDQSAFTFTSGYTGLSVGTQSSGSAAVVGAVAYKTTAGTAAETAGTTGWTGDAAHDRYTLLATFTTVSGSLTVAVTGAGTGAAAVTASRTDTAAVSGTETAAATVTVTRTDTAAVAGAGTGAATVTTSRTDTVAVAAARTGSATITTSRTDTAAVSATGAGSASIVAGVDLIICTVSGTAVGAALVEASVISPRGGSWWQLDDIFKDRAQRYAEERSRPPTACVCGEPLRTGPAGELFCPFDGRRYGGLGPAY